MGTRKDRGTVMKRMETGQDRGKIVNQTETAKKPLAIYLHIPFCVRKCLYCDFLSASASEEQIEYYVNLLLREIQASADSGQLQDYEAETVFVGGGTPSLLSSRQLETVLCKLKSVLPVRADAEITVEMNPGTVTKTQLSDMMGIGINRISIGVQSFQDAELFALGRIHKADEVYRLWEWTEQLGFRNRNLDLMSGIPGQTEQSLLDTLNRAVSLKPEHLSVYSLIVEEGTPFYEMYPDGAVDEETDRRLYALTKAFLRAQGYERYEISNYAKDGYACRHNLTYWTRGEYLGFGLGAASLMKDVRLRNAADLARYEKDIAAREVRAAEAMREQGERGALLPYAEREALSEEDCMAEMMFLGLRLIRGVPEQAFYDRFGKSLDEVYGDVLKKHMKNGLLEQKDGFFFLTERGLDVSNYVMADFIK